ncbi:LacI family DNA-binding transcriptional regulator [Streptomyces sp. NPDC021020]|uniref:LacI family DNA-binding transcriptional regulator n=1 Tax=Streptomyces sp. NPDC021020 TaxID=3365109 RepID=UPI0037A75829
MGEVRPTIDDVARAAGVSRSTVSRVINDVPGASPPVRTRVRVAAAELGYHPSQAARTLASGRPRTVDLVAVTYDTDTGWLGAHPYYSRVLAGLMPALEGGGAQLRVLALGAEAAAERIDALADDATTGMILANITPELAARLYRRCPRIVSLVPTTAAIPALEADNTGGARTAVAHLHALGRRRVAAVHGPGTNTCAIDRRTGYEDAVRRLGLPAIGAPGGFCREGGHAAAARLLADHPDIDAMFVACDLMAAGAVQAITATGRRVPDDVAIVGFDDSIAATCANPPLTTMRLPVEQMAAEAARMLLDGTPARGYRRTYPVELVCRESA